MPAKPHTEIWMDIEADRFIANPYMNRYSHSVKRKDKNILLLLLRAGYTKEILLEKDIADIVEELYSNNVITGKTAKYNIGSMLRRYRECYS